MPTWQATIESTLQANELEWVAVSSGGMNVHHSTLLFPGKDPYLAGVGLLYAHVSL